MLCEQFKEAAARARNSASLDHVSRLLWKAHAEGCIDEVNAEAISEAVHARRRELAIRLAPASSKPASARRRPAPRSPDRQASMERRRRQAASGVLPPAIAANFTLGEQAALAVIAREANKSGICALPIDAIAALAGVSRSTVQNAMREARRRGLIDVRERRRPGRPSLTNLVRIVSPDWVAWLRIGCKKLSTTNNSFNYSLLWKSSSRNLTFSGALGHSGHNKNIEGRKKRTE